MILLDGTYAEGTNMKKRTVIAVALAIMVLASIFAFYVPAVGYWQGTSYIYQKVGDNWVTREFGSNVLTKGCFFTVYCQSLRRITQASFDLVVTLTNATFPDNTQTARIAYNLKDLQEHGTNLTFTIKDGVRSFTIALSLQPHQLFLRSENMMEYNQNPLPYYNNGNDTYEPILLA